MLALTGMRTGLVGGGAPKKTLISVGANTDRYQGARAIPRRMPKPRSRNKNVAALVAAVIPDAARAKPIELWWQDEARIGQQGSLTRIWARRGGRPTASRDRRYQSAYLFAAVCPDRGVGAGSCD